MYIMNQSNITFVTSFFYIYERDYDENKSTLWRIERFREIAKTGIQICIYTCPVFEKYIKLLVSEFPRNVILMKTMSIQNTMIGEICNNNEYYLPEIKNQTKDVSDYLIVINSKTEFMEDSVNKNPFNSTHFAWIDFNISHVFFEKEKSLTLLKYLSNQIYKPNCFVIPGCWDKYNNQFITHVTETIHWRFCGGFFLGDKDSILHFHKLYKTHFINFIKQHKKLVWEVNFWAWLESNSDWNPNWYKGDHNDSIILVPPSIFSQIILEIDCSKQYQYDLMQIDGYYPSSSSYVYFENKHFLNIRYVNYWYYPDGNYSFPSGIFVIRTKNVLAELENTNIDGEQILIPKNYVIMKENISIPENDFYSRNVEDMRLYTVDNKIRYIGTTVGYHTTGGNRMIVGNYDVTNHEYNDICIVEPPYDTWCEKNWIPLVTTDEQEYFIYKWSPFEIGKINSNDNKLNIIYSFNETINAPFFHKTRGSTPFIETADGLLGIVHFSEEFKPRQYFHVFVLLDKNTFRPMKFSNPFIFEKIGIEFCIGFKIDFENKKYLFWISRFDRDPILITTKIGKIHINNVF